MVQSPIHSEFGSAEKEMHHILMWVGVGAEALAIKDEAVVEV